MNLLHVTLNPSTDHQPNRAIVQLCFLWLCFNFQAEGEPFNQFAFKVLLITGMSFFFPSISLLWLLNRYWLICGFVSSLSMETV